MKFTDLTLLFADDEPAIRKVYQKAFSKDGFQILLCENADQVLEKLKQQKVDLMVLDLQMPGMDKMDIFAILREQYPDIPALVVSGVYKGVVEDFTAKGYDTTTFFNKPASLIELKKSVYKLLKIDALGTFLTDTEVG